MSELFRVLCATFVGFDVSVSLLADGFRVIRAHNGKHAVSGLLVFDGSRCLHYLEGSEANVRSAVALVRDVTPGGDFKLLHEGPFAGPRMLTGWAVGYPLDAESEALLHIEALQGITALQALEVLCKELDLESGVIRISSDDEG
jgi:hypothetical protein